MDEIPSEFSGDLLYSIRSGLLRVESKRRDGLDVNICLKESYDVYAARLQEAGRTLDDTLLTESIPGWVFQWAVAHDWLPYPPLRPRRNSDTELTSGKYISSHEPVPDEELTVPFGCYKVTGWYKADLMKRLGSRISHWQAEAWGSLAAGDSSKSKQALVNDREMRVGDSPELPADNTADLPKATEQALGILGRADEQADEMVLSAIHANDGTDTSADDLDVGGVRNAEETALKIRQADNTMATKLLYNTYAECYMTRASSADGFIATLDIVFQRVMEVLKGWTDRDAIRALRQEWSKIARDRAAAGWFVARAPKVTMGAPITNPFFWSDLEKRFRALGNEYGDRLAANWISSAWREDGEQWCLRGGQDRESEMFRALAERAAVGLGHPAGLGAMFFWLDLLKRESANFGPGYGGRDGDGNVWHAGVIRKPCEASADQCFRHETRLRVPQSALGGEPNKQGIDNTEDSEQTERATEEESAYNPRQTRANDWQEVEISFFNERSAQITIGDTKHIREFGELGMADGRTGNPTLAWQMLHALAAANGVFDRPTSENPDWRTVEKRMQELRAWLRERYHISTDPIPYTRGSGYVAKFKINCARSYQK